jgi:RNA-binding protein YlmH
MKFGIKREKIGDIIVTDFGADIILFSDISKILIEDLKQLTRFRKSEITIESINDVTDVMPEFEECNIIVTSLRLDNFVAEIANCSRTIASEIVNEGRVFVNSINEFKDSKKIEINDIITIRGKGKFIFDGIEKETKSGRLLINMRRYK